MYSSSSNYDKHIYYSVKMFYQELTLLFHKRNHICWIDIRKCFKLNSDTSTFWENKWAVFIEKNFYCVRVSGQIIDRLLYEWIPLYYFVMHILFKTAIKIEVMAFLLNYIMLLCSEFQQRPCGCSVEIIIKYDIVIHYPKPLFKTCSYDQPKLN